MAVICGHCTLCCERNLVPLMQGEDASQYRTQVVDGVVALQRNGQRCTYLTKAGCSIYAHRPQACREFDCREVAAAHAAGDWQAIRWARLDKQNRRILKRGRELNCRKSDSRVVDSVKAVTL